MDEKERRHFRRINFDTSIKLTGKHKVWNCNLIDISLKGVLIEYPENWDAVLNDKFDLEMSLNEDKSVVIKMEVLTIHIEDDRAGLRCQHIDIESISHLRRILELNLGDPELINREFAELGKMPH